MGATSTSEMLSTQRYASCWKEPADIVLVLVLSLAISFIVHRQTLEVAYDARIEPIHCDVLATKQF
jgi:hypothetical protein